MNRESIEKFVAPKAMKLMARLHTAAFKLSGGRIGGTMMGVPALLLDHTGRKSGKQFTTPLFYIEDGDSLVVVASQGGMPTNPQWYLNLVKEPETTVRRAEGRDPERVRARTATAAEKAELWPRLVAVYPDYEAYQAKTDRDIPVVFLDPVS